MSKRRAFVLGGNGQGDAVLSSIRRWMVLCVQFSVIAMAANVLSGGRAISRLGANASIEVVIACYVVGFFFAGLITGLLRTLQMRSVMGAAIVGFCALLPLGVLISIALSPFPIFTLKFWFVPVLLAVSPGMPIGVIERYVNRMASQ